jgi:hypothetical protein
MLKSSFLIYFQNAFLEMDGRGNARFDDLVFQ